MAQLIVILLVSLRLPSTLYAGTTLKDLPLQPNSVPNPWAGNPGIEYGVPELLGIAGSPNNGESFHISEERKIIAQALQQASAEFNIPLRTLQGIAFVQSRWGHIIPHGPSDTPPE